MDQEGYTLEDVYRNISHFNENLFYDLSQEMRFGLHRSVYVGEGTIFNRIRRYDHQRDDPKNIRWQLIEPDGELYVREFIKTRERTAVVLGDLSESMRFAVGMPEKEKMLLEITGIIGLTCARNRDKFGFVGYAEDVLFSEDPRAGQDHVHFLLRKIYDCFQSGVSREKSDTNVEAAIRHLIKMFDSNSLIVVVTDLTGCERLLATELLEDALALNQEMVFFILHDPNEFKRLEGWFGTVPMLDMERKKIRRVPRRRIKDIKMHLAKQRKLVREALQGYGVDCEFLTPGEHQKDVIKLFSKRRAA